MRFAKGQSGNPGGRPKETGDIRLLARAHGPEAIRKLAEHMMGDDPRVSVAAAQALLDRGYGKPAQSIVGGDDADNPLRLVTEIRRVIVEAKHNP